MKISRNWLSDYIDVSKLSPEQYSELITTKVAEIEGVQEFGDDLVIEIDNKSLTHRPDLWSHFGFARELSAILDKPLKKNPDSFADCTKQGAKLLSKLGRGKANFKIQIDKNSDCRRFSLIEFSNLKVEDSPEWMKKRLEAVGAGVRNFLVDLSNYVMLDIGQPNHAYDTDKISGSTLSIRKATAGEKFTALDEQELELTKDDIAIADASGVIALGGVIGGLASSVSDSTNKLLLESANFDPTTIRLSTKQHAVRTDASNRFEKSRSAFSVPLASTRFAELLLEVQPEAKIDSVYYDEFPERPAEIKIDSSYSYISQRLGIEEDNKLIQGILTSLNFAFEKERKNNFSVSVPYYRATRDVSIPDDLVEEVGRIYGYEKIAEKAPTILSETTTSEPIKGFEAKLKESLRGLGFSEIDSDSFMSLELANSLGFETKDLVILENPVDADLPALQCSLIPSMLEAANKNLKQTSDLALFEIGRTYEKIVSDEHQKLNYRRKFQNVACFERRMLSLAYLAEGDEKSLAKSLEPELTSGANFYGLVTAIKRIASLATKGELRLNQLEASSKQLTPATDFNQYKNWMHPFRAASIELAGVVIGSIAQLNPKFLDKKRSCVLAEIDLELLLEADTSVDSYNSLDKFPDSLFEMSVVMPKQKPYLELEELIRDNVSCQLLKEIEVVSVYTGKPLSDREKSVSVKLKLGANDRTLSSDELSGIQDELMKKIEASEFSLRT